MLKKYAVITGASRGIGAGIALALAREGYNLALCCQKSETTLSILATELADEFGIQVHTFVGDVSSEPFVSELQAGVSECFPRVDLLVNNAGIWTGGLITDMSLGDWNNLLNVNLTSVFLMCRAFTPGMVREKSGHIVNISSVWGNRGASCETAYSATKGGINAFTKALAKELGPSGIRVNAIAPGMIDTDMNAGYSEDEVRDIVDGVALGRIGTVDDVGAALVGLDNSGYITGCILNVDGGFLGGSDY